MPSEQATLGGGCFWCLEAAFEQVDGVTAVESGYAGGEQPNPSYEQVCSGSTGHAEVVRVQFDPERIGYRELLEIFFSIHDPTTLNRQGADVGPQYRSVIFFHNEQQREIAEELIAHLNQAEIWPRPIVTELSPLSSYYPAEPYHQDYYRKHPEQGYCQAVIAPKLAKLHQHHAKRLRE